MAYADWAETLAMTVMRVCSLMLKGPGLQFRVRSRFWSASA